MPPAPRVHIISDHMAATLHPATGARLESKSEFRRLTRDNGFVELGNDAFAEASRPREFSHDGQVKADIVEAIQMLNQGYTPPPLDTADSDTRMYA